MLDVERQRAHGSLPESGGLGKRVGQAGAFRRPYFRAPRCSDLTEPSSLAGRAALDPGPGWVDTPESRRSKTAARGPRSWRRLTQRLWPACGGIRVGRIVVIMQDDGRPQQPDKDEPGTDGEGEELGRGGGQPGEDGSEQRVRQEEDRRGRQQRDEADRLRSQQVDTGAAERERREDEDRRGRRQRDEADRLSDQRRDTGAAERERREDEDRRGRQRREEQDRKRR